MGNFDYLRPQTLSELNGILNKNHKNAYLYAGGTDLLVKIRHQTISPDLIIDLKGVREFQGIKKDKVSITIGSAVTLSEVAESKLLQEHYPSLCEACLNVGSTQIRNRGTLAGNLCNASPAADTVPPLLIFDAKVNLVTPKGKRTVSIHEFTTGVGKTILAKNEVLASISLPYPGEKRTVFLKNSRRKALDLSTVCLAAGIFTRSKKKEIRVAVGACAPITQRARKAEDYLNHNAITSETIDQASHLLPLKPISDLRGSAVHRDRIARVLFRKALAGLSEVKK
ncbi:MAG: xanthine dehydrogenase family protein subunit M [Candidatus Wallbacteria bacterium]|nr:xanthine dehydrogenase family protein subunit M [Candidatus Wallbacteria bacterium]